MAEAASPPPASPSKAPAGAAYKVAAFRRLEERLDEYSALPSSDLPSPGPLGPKSPGRDGASNAP
eukprot:5502434-Prymnesium_polylepis.1